MSSSSNHKVNPNNDWKCPDCSNMVFGSKKACRCGKWRPRSTTPNNQSMIMKKGDWKCEKCQYLNFASKQKCGKCNSEPPQLNQIKKESRPGDWLCSECNEMNFGSRTNCFKCQKAKNGEGLCAICTENRADTCLKTCGHIVMCFECSSQISECPVCRKEYIQSDIIKTFVAV